MRVRVLSEWLWSGSGERATADELAAAHRAVLAGEEQPTPLSDPGVANMFDDAP